MNNANILAFIEEPHETIEMNNNNPILEIIPRHTAATTIGHANTLHRIIIVVVVAVVVINTYLK